MNGKHQPRKATCARAVPRKAAAAPGLPARPGLAPAVPAHLPLAAKRHIVSMQGRQGAGAPILGRMVPLAPSLAHLHGRGPGPQGDFRPAPDAGAHKGQEAAHTHFHTTGGHRPRDKRAAAAA
jgi:hypothetical protein